MAPPSHDRNENAMTFDDVIRMDPATLRNMNARGGENSTNCTLCTECTLCTNCEGCTCCLGYRGCTGCKNCVGCTGCRNCTGCTGCTWCTWCTDCTDCRDCWGVKGGRDLRYVAFDVPLTAEQWEQFLEKMNAPTTEPRER